MNLIIYELRSRPMLGGFFAHRDVVLDANGVFAFEILINFI